MKRSLWRVVFIIAVILLVFELVRWSRLSSDSPLAQNSVETTAQVNVYSSRKEALMSDLFTAFEREHGVKVNVVVDKAAKLLERMRSEGEHSPVDVFLTADIGNLSKAKSAGLLQSIDSEVLQNNIAPSLRDDEGYWFALSQRVRAIFYSKENAEAATVDTYSELADPKWKGKLLIRSSSNIYNQSLIAWMIEKHGRQYTQKWVDGLVQNFARKPQGGDTDQLRALAAGEGELAVANSYYYMRLLESDKPEDKALAQRIGIIFPDQDLAGAHVNISGGGIAAHAKHRSNAVALLEFLSQARAQEVYASGNYEYPVLDTVALPEGLQALGDFKRDDASLLRFVDYLEPALLLAKESGWR